MEQHITFDKSKIRLLTMCCTFRRPIMLGEMLESFYKTKSEGTEIIIYLQEDDPYLQDYLSIVATENYIIDTHRFLCEVMNHIVFDLFPGIPYYQTICDDHLYETEHWDEIILKELYEKANDIGFACPADGINGGDWYKYEHPSAEIYSWKFVNIIGYVYPKNMKQMGADFYAKDISKSLNALTFVPEVMVKHRWFGGCNLPGDLNIQEGYTEAKLEEGVKSYHDWIINERNIVLNRIKQNLQ